MRIISIYDSSIFRLTYVKLQQKQAAPAPHKPTRYALAQKKRLHWPSSCARIYIEMIMILILDTPATAGLFT